MRRALVFLAIIALCAALAAPASADGAGWRLRVFAAGFDPDVGETVANDEGDDIRIGGGSDLGFGAGLEYRFTERFGLDFGIMQGAPEISLSADVSGFGPIAVADAMNTTVITGDLLVHLTPGAPTLDFYLGAGVASVSYGDLRYQVADLDSFDVSVDDDFTWSVRAGVDIAFGQDSKWAAVGGLRYVFTDLDLRQTDPPTSDVVSIGADLFNFTVGLAYSF